jgi:hypothetical protein
VRFEKRRVNNQPQNLLNPESQHFGETEPLTDEIGRPMAAQFAPPSSVRPVYVSPTLKKQICVLLSALAASQVLSLTVLCFEVPCHE